MIDNKYAAGFFDGEGCVCIRYDKRCNSYILKVSVANTSLEVLEKFKEKWGGCIVAYSPTKPHHKGWSDWILQGTNCKNFLSDMVEHSVVKKEQLCLALEFLTSCGATYKGRKLPREVVEFRSSMKEKLHALKTKGKGLRGAHG